MKGDPKIIDLLNQALELEIGATLQYLHHHWTGEGIEAGPILEYFEKVALDEMRHMEKLAERINFLEGDPSTKPAEVKKGGTLKKMIEDDLQGEYNAIAFYRTIVDHANQVGDTTTRLLMEEIIMKEEEHADLWETLLEKHGKPLLEKRAKKPPFGG